LVSSVPDIGGARGPGPHHVHMFSHMCDMCVSLESFLSRKVCL